jgi:hypothetical protein
VGVSPTNCAAAATFAATQRRDNEASPTTRTSSPISADSQDGADYKGLCTRFDLSSLNREERGAGRAHLPDIPEEQLSFMSVTFFLAPTVPRSFGWVLPDRPTIC